MRRKSELDSIRGLAALAIVVFHLWLRQVGSLGLAVNVFFVLSGYLITSIILANEPTTHFLFSFYIRRCLRIWPIYYLALAVLVVVNPFLPTSGNLENLPYYLTYTQEISHYWSATDPTFPEAFRHTWTLAIEEQFYLFWPPLLLVAGRRCLPLVAAIWVGLALAARAMNVNQFTLITQCDGLALGGLLAYLIGEQACVDNIQASMRRLVTGLCVLFAGVVLALVVLAKVRLLPHPEVLSTSATASLVLLGANLVVFAMAAVIVLNAGKPWLGWLRDRRLVYLGTISYGLYLYHQVLFTIWDNLARSHGWPDNLLTDLAKLVASIGLAALSWQFFERPIMALKDRFPYQRAASPAAGMRPRASELGGVETG